MKNKLISANGLRWADTKCTMISMLVEIDGFEDTMQFIASQNDSEEHGRAWYQMAVNGDFGEIAPYVEPVIDIAEVEMAWQTAELEKVEAALKPYTEDMQIPEQYSELRKTENTEENYYKLLMDRKLLVEYLLQPDFPECGRPTLSGLAV